MSDERQIDKCEVCNDEEYQYIETFKYKNVQIRSKVCGKCAIKLNSDEFARFRTIEPREVPIKTLRRR